MRYSSKRMLSIILLFALSLLAQGCFMVIARQPGNRPLSHVRLPQKCDFKGCVFILDKPPKAEFVFLLAQLYPHSFIVTVPKEQGEYSSFYLDRESRLPLTTKYLGIKQGDLILRDKGLFGHTKIPFENRMLPRLLIFHEMKMTALNELPEPIPGGPCIRLSWSSTSVWPNNDHHPVSQFFSDWFVEFPMALTLGVAWPPPIPNVNVGMGATHGPANQKLHVTINADKDISIDAGKKAERGFMCGMTWYLLLSPFISDTPRVMEPSDSGGRSPGGWADCLEQLVRSPEVLKAAASATLEGTDSRESKFNEQYKLAGYLLQKLPYVGKYKCDERQVRVLPSNPVLNLSLNPFPVAKVGRVEWPGICVFEDAANSQNSFWWEGYKNGANRFVQVMEMGDKTQKAAESSKPAASE